MFFEVPELDNSPFPALQTLHVEGWKMYFKGTVNAISSDPPCQKGQCPIYKGILKTPLCVRWVQRNGCANLSKTRLLCIQLRAVCAVCVQSELNPAHTGIWSAHT